MPFPWKKVKNTKISQMVSDHLASQRRQRGHLVVETGFPTSLVDLFVKNRDRLKKSKSYKKKKKIQNIDDSSHLPSSSSSSSSSSFPLQPSPSLLKSPLISQMPSSSSLALTPAVYEGLKKADGLTDEVGNEMNERPNAKRVLGAILRVFFVVVLALGAKKFAVGLTMSAFLLFLVEYVGKFSYRLLVPCSVANRRLRLIMQSISEVICFRDKSFDDSDTGIKGQLGASSEFNNHVDSNPMCEIQIAQPMFMEDIQGVRKEIGESSFDSSELQFEKEFHCSSFDGKSEFERFDSKMMVVAEKEVKDGCDIAESKKGNSKKARMKLKMKHLIPRKLRGSKKEKRDFEGETNPIKEEIVAVLEEPQENDQGDVRNLKCDSKLSLSLSRSEGGSDQINMIFSSGAVCVENLEQFGIREEQKEQRKGNSGYLIICLIVLMGLVGGRIIAFVFMVLWFLMLKSGEKLRRYIMKLPLIRSLTEKSC